MKEEMSKMILVSSKYDKENAEVININKKSREGCFLLGSGRGVGDKSGFMYMSPCFFCFLFFW